MRGRSGAAGERERDVSVGTRGELQRRGRSALLCKANDNAGGDLVMRTQDSGVNPKHSEG